MWRVGPRMGLFMVGILLWTAALAGASDTLVIVAGHLHNDTAAATVMRDVGGALEPLSSPYVLELASDTTGLYAGSLRSPELHVATQLPALNLVVVSISAGLRMGSDVTRNLHLSHAGDEHTIEAALTLVLWVVPAEVPAGATALAARFLVHDESGALAPSEPFELSVQLPPAAPVDATDANVLSVAWMEALIAKYGGEGASSLNETTFSGLVRASFPLLGGGDSDGDDHDHDHEHHRRANTASNVTIPSECFLPDALFDFYDTDADGQLSSTEMVGVAATLAQMLADSCHRLRAVLAEPAPCVYEVSTQAQRWGYAFLTGVVLMAMSAMGLLEALLSLKAAKWAQPLARRIGAGAMFGVSLLIVFPLLVRVESPLTAYGLDGAGSSSGHDLDFLWPLIVVTAVTMLIFVIHILLIARPTNTLAGAVDVQMHDSIDAWAAEPDAPRHLLNTTTSAAVATATSRTYDWAMVVIPFCTDALMNLCTGILFGSSWVSPRLGLMVSATVVIFEFLLKIGFIASYRTAGVSCARTALLCLAASILTIVGLIVGVTLGSAATDANRYLFAFAEAFLWYHALVLLLPYTRDGEESAVTVVGMVALCAGFAVVLILVTVGPAGPALPAALCV